MIKEFKKWNEELLRAKSKPILFSTEMVKAILAGRKTMTRRIIKPQPSIKMGVGKWIKNKVLQMIGDQSVVTDYMEEHNPYGQRGDLVWVREKFKVNNIPTGYLYHFYANNDTFTNPDYEKWKPSIFMPKEAARIWLEITDIRVERIQDITEEDAKAEGVLPMVYTSTVFKSYNGFKNYYRQDEDEPAVLRTAKESFKSLWFSINGEKSWNENIWVWVVNFKIISGCQ